MLNPSSGKKPSTSHTSPRGSEPSAGSTRLRAETFFPSDDDRKRLRGLKISEMPDEDRYRYHAYNYGWQRAMLNRFDEFEPLDPDGDWYVANMADRAEEYQRKKMGMKPRYKAQQKPLDPDTIRPNWKQLLPRDLTQAERKLALAFRDEIMRRYQSENPKGAAQLERIVGYGDLAPTAPEISKP